MKRKCVTFQRTRMIQKVHAICHHDSGQASSSERGHTAKMVRVKDLAINLVRALVQVYPDVPVDASKAIMHPRQVTT